MTVIYNTNFTHNPNSYLTLVIEQAAKDLWGEENVVVADNMNLLSIAASGEHDVLICIDGQRSNTDLFKRLRPSFKTMIFWSFEDPFMLDFNVNATMVFDYVFTNDPACVDAYKVETHYLPLAAGKSIHYRPVKNANELDYDIFFAGTMWPNRVRVLEQIIATFPNARLKLICPSNEYLSPLPMSLRRHAIRRSVSIKSFIDFANASSVTLTMFRNYASHGTIGQATAPGPRLYELALAGTAQVIELPSEMDEQYLEEFKGVKIARNTMEITNHVDQILREKQLRKKMALDTQKAVYSKHLYNQRLEKIQNITQANFLRNKTEIVPVSSLERDRKLRILFVTHSTIHEHVWGGIEVYQQILCASLGKNIDFFYWLRRRGACHLTDVNGVEIECFDMPDIGWLDSMNDSQEEQAFSSILDQYGFDIVHIQHLGHHTLSLPIIAKACGLKVIFSFHDFVTICSHYNLLNYEQRYCCIGEKTIGACDICLKISEDLEFGVQETRRSFVSSMLKSIDVCLFGTQHSYDLHHKIYPVLNQKERYVLGIPSPETTLPLKQKEYNPLDGRPLRVATIGNFIRSKGADSIICIIQSANPKLYEFHIFGYIQPEYEAVLKELKQDNIVIHGAYSIGDVSALNIADVALILSIWPETYCISLSEAWQNGLIPIVSDIGALGDRVIDGVNGFKLRVADSSTVIDRLELIRSDERLRYQIMKNITPELWVNPKDYAAELLAIYKEMAPQKELGVSNLKWDIGQLHFLPHSSWKNQAPPRHIFDASLESKLFVELPIQVEDWATVQGANYYIDDICYHILNVYHDNDFTGADEFHIRGWFVFPDVSMAGALYTALIHKDSDLTIFLECNRENREDVTSSFSDAPRHNGFVGQSALRGKWCEGVFRIALINVVNGSAAFQLTNNEIEVREGKVKRIQTVAHENQVILDDFIRVVEKDSLLRGIKLKSFVEEQLYIQKVGKLEYNFDYFSGLTNQEELLNEDSRNIITVSGWAYNHIKSVAGRIYMVFVGDKVENSFIVGLSRFIRQETLSTFHGAPLCNGFYGQLRLNEGYHVPIKGNYRICLVNVVRGEYVTAITNILIKTADGYVQQVSEEPIPDKEIKICHEFIAQKSNFAFT